MRLRTGLVVLLSLAMAVMVTMVADNSKSTAPADVRILSVTELESTNLVMVEFVRRNPSARFAEAHRVQLRVAGKWQPPEGRPEFGRGDLFARTNCLRLVFAFPRQTEGCRFFLSYRVGTPPYCDAYFFLQRHGFSKEFPKFSRAILKCVPQRPRLRHLECELMSRQETDQRKIRPEPERASQSFAPSPHVGGSLIPANLRR